MGIENLIENIEFENELVQDSNQSFKSFHREFSNKNFALLDSENILDYEPVFLESIRLTEDYKRFEVKSLPVLNNMISHFNDKISYFKNQFNEVFNNTLSNYKALNKKDLNSIKLRETVNQIIFLDTVSDKLNVKIAFQKRKVSRVNTINEKIINYDKRNYDLINPEIISVVEELNSSNRDFSKLNIDFVLNIAYDVSKYDEYSSNIFLGNSIKEYKGQVSVLVGKVDDYKIKIKNEINTFLSIFDSTLTNKTNSFDNVPNYLDKLRSISNSVNYLNHNSSKLGYKHSEFSDLVGVITQSEYSFKEDVSTYERLKFTVNQLKKVNLNNYLAETNRINGLLDKDFSISNQCLGEEFNLALDSYFSEKSRINTLVYDNKKLEENAIEKKKLEHRKSEDKIELKRLDLKLEEQKLEEIALNYKELERLDCLNATDNVYGLLNDKLSQEKVYFELTEPLEKINTGIEFPSQKLKMILLGQERDILWNDRFDAANNYLGYVKELKLEDSKYFFMNVGDMVNKSAEKGYLSSMIEMNEVSKDYVDKFLSNVNRLLSV